MRSRNLIRFASVSTLLALGIFGSKSAHAEADTFGLGSGRTGAGSITTAGTVVNTYAGVTASVAVGATAVTTSNGAAFAPGDLVLIWQTTAYSGVFVSGVQTATGLSGTEPAGTFEYARVKSVATNVVTLTNPVVGAYAANATQMVKVPEYTTLSIAAAGSIVASPWDGAKGGIAIVFASGAVTNAGTISADASGFRGGVVKNDDTTYGCAASDGPVTDGTVIPGGGGATFNALAGGAKKGEGLVPARFSLDITNPTVAASSLTYGRGNITNGGGGGDCHNAGGGGGGHGGLGGNGGGTWAGELDATGLINTGGRTTASGLGGSGVTYDPLVRLVCGGGGGAGEENNGDGSNGGNGAGVVVVRAASLAGAGTITANGGTAANSLDDGAGGGGAGGLVVVRVTGNATCGGIQANGGAGGHCDTDHGPGAGGSGGIVLLQAATNSCTATEAPGANGDDGTDAGRSSDPGSGGVTKTPPTGGYTPGPCDQAINACGGCVTNSDCGGTEICNTTTNKCTLSDGGVIPSDGGSGTTDGGSGTSDGGSGTSDGGSGNGDGGSTTTDGGSGTGDAGFGSDGGNGNGNGNGNGTGDDTGDLEGGGCSTSGTGSDGTGAVVLGFGLFAALAFMRRKKR